MRNAEAQQIAQLTVATNLTDDAPDVDTRINNAVSTLAGVPDFDAVAGTRTNMRNEVLRQRANTADQRLAVLERDPYAVQGNAAVVAAVTDGGNTWTNGELQNPSEASTAGVLSGDSFLDTHWCYTYRPLPTAQLGWVRTVKA